ncbi:hypothetical protein DMJ13_18575 [halophilic archaeon]|nr:hypothetical protein DMJ13_18575 [halophilic archaeon]
MGRGAICRGQTSAGTSKECATCDGQGIVDRRTLCPSYGFKASRDTNIAVNIRFRSFKYVGVGHSDSLSLAECRR